MAHAVGIRLGEREVLAAIRHTHRGIADRKIADMQFVDGHVGLRGDLLRERGLFPALRFECRRAQIGYVAAQGIRGQADRIGIGHPVAHHAHTRHEDLDQIGVVMRGQILFERRRPDAGLVVALHGFTQNRPTATTSMQAQGNLPCGGRPQLEIGLACSRGRTQRLFRFGSDIQIIQCAGQLHRSGLQYFSIRAFMHQHHLLAQKFRHSRKILHCNRQLHAFSDESEACRNGGRQLHFKRRQQQMAFRPSHSLAGNGAYCRIRGVVQTIVSAALQARPLQCRPIQPVGTGLHRRMGGLRMQHLFEAGCVARFDIQCMGLACHAQQNADEDQAGHSQCMHLPPPAGDHARRAKNTACAGRCRFPSRTSPDTRPWPCITSACRPAGISHCTSLADRLNATSSD